MRIGIIGAGQLGQMLGFAAQDLGHECIFVDPGESPPAAAAGTVICAAFDDADALAALAAKCDVVTYEFENVPVGAIEAIMNDVDVYPPPAALHYAQDRLNEKTLFAELDIPLPAYHAVDSLEDLHDAVETVGLPLVLKTRRMGYDGKGQQIVRDAAGCEAAWEKLGPVPLIAEQWVDFDFEVSVIATRNVAGDIAVYPLSHNEHDSGILHRSRAPVDDSGLLALATGYVTRLVERLDYVGTIALELFVVGDRLLANEFAPRVHNSGHWTIEGARTSQFQNHLLAIMDQPLGDTGMAGHAGMLNLIGTIPDGARSLETGNLHDYGKAPRPGRKLGHITIVGDSAVERDRLLDSIEQSVTQSAPA